jgi:hypothetical protein
LTNPLVLSVPVKIQGGSGTRLLFQPSTANPNWHAAGAIQIQASNIALDGFTIDFMGDSSHWTDVGGTASKAAIHLQPPSSAPVLSGISINHLVINVPPGQTTGTNEHAINLITTSGVKNLSGWITNCIFKGGDISLMGGPWDILDNDFQGPQDHSYVDHTIEFTFDHDLTVQRNQFHVVSQLGYVHRVFHIGDSEYPRGFNEVFSDNQVDRGIGQLEAPYDGGEREVILTENYLPFYEGVPAAISSDGYVLEVPYLRGVPATTGDVVSILSGGLQTKQWRMIAQALGPAGADHNSSWQFLLDEPLPSGNYIIAISRGFINDTYEGNTVDLRTPNKQNPSILDPNPGLYTLNLQTNHYGTQVLNNTFMGGLTIIGSAATQSPADKGYGGQFNGNPPLNMPIPPWGDSPPPWGWTHMPFLDFKVDGNTFVDNIVEIKVLHESTMTADNGRRYLKGSFTNNVFRWTAATQPGFTIGEPANSNPDPSVNELDFTTQNYPWYDDGEMSLTVQNNWGSGAGGTAATLRVVAGQITPTPTGSPLPGSPSAGPALTASVISTSEIDLTWTPVVGMVLSGDRYQIDRYNGTSWSQIALVEHRFSTYEDTSLSAGTLYRYRIRAVTSAGHSPYSATVSATTTGASAPPLVATSLGQDGQDYVGSGATANASDGHQDIHLVLAGLASSKTISSIEVLGYGGGIWRYGGAYGSDKAWLIQTAGATTADLYIQPYQNEPGHSFNVTVYYTDSTSTQDGTNAVYADYPLADPSATGGKGSGAD